jgi:TPR repeat protein
MLADANTNALAQYKLALMHLDGGGGLKDEAKAAELLLNSITLCETVQTRAIEAGDLDERPPSIEDEGSYRTKLFMTIAKNWHQEIKQGEGDNGRFLQYLISTLPDLAILTETPALSDKDLDYACYKLAGLYLSGKPAPINDSEVARFFKDAAAKGISDKNISVERLRLYLTGLARKESGPTIRWPGEKAQSADVKEAEEDSLMRARQLEQEKAARELKAKEEQAARAKQEEEELRIKSGPLYNLRKNPMDKAELAKLKSSIQASQIPGEKCSWSIIYCLGMLATGNTSEGFAVRAYIGREFAQQDISVISDRNLSDMCGKCENGRCKLTCQKCKGTATCISCGGSGMRRGSGFDGQLRCLICNGNGICKECNATGSRTETCRACSGRGYSFSPDKCKSAYLGLLGSVDLSASETKPPEGQPREAQQAEKPPSRQDENRLQKAPPSLLNGLALYYDFAKDTRPAVKNTANNMSDGSVNCAAWSREGKFGGAYSFTAPDGRIRISWKTQIQDSFTIAAWVYPTKKTSLPTPSVTGQGALDGLAYVFAPKHGNNDKSAGIGLSVGINGAVVTEHADVHLPAVLTYPHQFDSAWHHFVVAVSGGQAVLYVDGQMVQQGVKSTRAHLLCPEELGIGGWRDRSVFTGMIDEVAVWTRKLSAADIKALYQNQ